MEIEQQEHTVRRGFERDFFMVPNGIAFEDISPSALKVYMLFSAMADSSNHSCFPSLRTVAKLTNFSRATVQKAIKELENKNLVQVQRTKSDPPSTAQNNVYTVLKPQENNLKKLFEQARGGSKIDPGVDQKLIRNNTNNNNTIAEFNNLEEIPFSYREVLEVKYTDEEIIQALTRHGFGENGAKVVMEKYERAIIVQLLEFIVACDTRIKNPAAFMTYMLPQLEKGEVQLPYIVNDQRCHSEEEVAQELKNIETQKQEFIQFLGQNWEKINDIKELNEILKPLERLL